MARHAFVEFERTTRYLWILSLFEADTLRGVALSQAARNGPASDPPEAWWAPDQLARVIVKWKMCKIHQKCYKFGGSSFICVVFTNFVACVPDSSLPLIRLTLVLLASPSNLWSLLVAALTLSLFSKRCSGKRQGWCSWICACLESAQTLKYQIYINIQSAGFNMAIWFMPRCDFLLDFALARLTSKGSGTCWRYWDNMR